MNTVECDKHGTDEATAVCTHIVQTLRDHEPRGFLCSIDEDNEYQAVCTACRQMPDDEWSRTAGDFCTIICLGCFKKAAALNGVDLPERSV